jgi:glycerol uptake facilitator-like aquaporin
LDKILAIDEENRPMKWKALVAEFIGTFAFVFISVGTITVDQILSGRVDLH